jgi:hypothetical protein
VIQCQDKQETNMSLNEKIHEQTQNHKLMLNKTGKTVLKAAPNSVK